MRAEMLEPLTQQPVCDICARSLHPELHRHPEFNKAQRHCELQPPSDLRCATGIMQCNRE